MVFILDCSIIQQIMNNNHNNKLRCKWFEQLKQIYIVQDIYNSFLSDNLKKLEIAKVCNFVKLIEKICLIKHYRLLFNNQIIIYSLSNQTINLRPITKVNKSQFNEKITASLFN